MREKEDIDPKIVGFIWNQFKSYSVVEIEKHIYKPDHYRVVFRTKYGPQRDMIANVDCTDLTQEEIEAS